ncbi:MAG: DUF1501 domain-containing protein [Vulcanimicrobiota bacterium]
MWTRRAFLKGSSLAVLACGWGGLPLFLARAASAQSGSRKTLVALFQRGAMDGLAAVQPLHDQELKNLRPQLLLPHQGEGKALELDGRYGLHPSLKPLQHHFQEQQLAIVHGIGSPHTTRSHFDAQDYMETGIVDRKNAASGWLNRASGLLGHEATPFRSVALTEALPKSLYGQQPTLAISSLDDFKIQSSSEATGDSLETLYRQATQQTLRRRGSEAFEAADVLSARRYQAYKPAPGVRYPRSPLGRSLRQIAFLVKSEVGLEIAFTESNGWDTHRAQGQGRGIFANRAADLANSIDAFWTDLGKHQESVVLMTMTEFGRTVAQNGAGGTDHGRGSCMFVLGGEVAGGKVYGQVGPLSRDNLEDGRDLPVTTDFRQLFAGVAGQHLGISSNSELFPRWNGRPLELLRS